MKRWIPLLLLFSLIFSGCGFFSERIMEPVTFYYLQNSFHYGKDASVIVAEEREASGHRQELSYLLALYLMGPAEEEHRSPLPPGTRILKAEQTGSKVTMELTNPAYSFSDSELSLACACLTLTCLDITDAQEVSITYLERTVTMTRESLTLYDDSKENLPTEETQ